MGSSDYKDIDLEQEVAKERAKKDLKKIDPEEEGDELGEAIQALLPVKETKNVPASQRTLSSLKKHRFLRHYILSYGRVTEACKLAGVPYTTFWSWTRKDPAFVEAYTVAQEAVIPLMEDTVREWGFQGINKAIVHKGEITGYTKERHALIAMFALKKLDPAYRDNAQLVGIKAGGDISVQFAEPRY